MSGKQYIFKNRVFFDNGLGFARHNGRMYPTMYFFFSKSPTKSVQRSSGTSSEIINDYYLSLNNIRLLNPCSLARAYLPPPFRVTWTRSRVEVFEYSVFGLCIFNYVYYYYLLFIIFIFYF